jgi:hypothetical protein
MIVDHVEVADRVGSIVQRVVAKLVAPAGGIDVELEHADRRLAVDQLHRAGLLVEEGLFEQRIEGLAVSGLGHALVTTGTLGIDAGERCARVGE